MRCFSEYGFVKLAGVLLGCTIIGGGALGLLGAAMGMPIGSILSFLGIGIIVVATYRVIASLDGWLLK